MTPDLTVAICTRNGASRLPEVLNDLVREGDSASRSWEVVVVDNGSSDETATVAAASMDRLPLRVVSEPQAGLARARNRALEEAASPVVVFIDDDLRLEEGWLLAWMEELESHADVAWFGGTVEPSWPEGRPGWVRDERLDLLAGVYGLHRVSRTSTPHSDGLPLPIGAHFAVRRAAVDQVGAFRVDLGLQGERRALGEETEWFHRAIGAGLAGRHVGHAVVRHPVPRRRLRLAALFRHGIASGVSHARIHPEAHSGSLLRACSQLFRGVGQWIRGRGDRFRQCVVNAGIEVGMRRRRTEREVRPPSSARQAP